MSEARTIAIKVIQEYRQAFPAIERITLRTLEQRPEGDLISATIYDTKRPRMSTTRRTVEAERAARSLGLLACVDKRQRSAFVPALNRWVLCTPIVPQDDAIAVLDLVIRAPGDAPSSSIGRSALLVADLIAQTLRIAKESTVIGEQLSLLATSFMALKHQIGNPLSFAIRHAETAHSNINDTEFAKRRLSEVLVALDDLVDVSSHINIFASIAFGLDPIPKLESTNIQDLNDMLTSVAHGTESTYGKTKDIRVDFKRPDDRTFPPRLEIQADRGYLKQCLLAVVDNAAKYAYDGSNVVISLARAKGGSLAIHVDDEGLPMTEEDILVIRGRGIRGRNALGEGQGLGLWITDALMRSSGGELVLAPSRGGRATRVSLLFPASRYGSARER
jgi:signal transduction histidine kinase